MDDNRKAVETSYYYLVQDYMTTLDELNDQTTVNESRVICPYTGM